MKKVRVMAIMLLIGVLFLVTNSKEVYANSLGSPTTFEISSKAYSTTLKWNKVKNAKGYVVYLKRSNGVYEKIRTTTSTSFTNKNLQALKSYTYKVKSYTKKNGRTVYSKFSRVVTIKTKQKTEPIVYTFLLEDTNEYANSVPIMIKNVSNKNITLNPTSFLYDDSYTYYDRDIELSYKNASGKWIFGKSLTVRPYEEVTVVYSVVGEPTWYDGNTILYIYFDYEGQSYELKATSKDNQSYLIN